jgi:cytochrome c-type protein NapC
MSEKNRSNNGGPLRRLWRNPLVRYGLSAVFGVSGLLLVVGSVNSTLEATNTVEFCISCHDMRTNFEEYKKTVHYSNRVGVRAGCSDCHVPKKNWFAEIRRKIVAVNDVWAELVGTIDTREKFEAKRLEMARHEWVRMKESDSSGCRNCHSYESMDMESQDRLSKKKHVQAVESGKTCIDCHKGIAHEMPKVQADNE